MKEQIKGKDKPFINDLLHNVEDLAEAFSVLDTHFGDVRTVLPRLRMKLDKLPSLPHQEEEENKNIQGILNHWKTARNHDIEERMIDVFFIQEYSEKLSNLHKKMLLDEEIEDCKPFNEKIKKVSENKPEVLAHK